MALDLAGHSVDTIGDGSAVSTVVETRGGNYVEAANVIRGSFVDEVDPDVTPCLFDVAG
jgi:hypothetical protein